MQNPDEEQWRNPQQCGKRKTRFACVGDADESTRPRVQGAVHKFHQDHLTEKGMNSLNLCNLFSQVLSDASSNENSGCKGSSGKIMSKIGQNSCMAAGESQKHEKGDG